MTDAVPFADLGLQWNEIADDVRRDFDALFARSAFTLGPYVEAFETQIAGYLQCRHAIGVNNGTSALHLAVLAAGLAPGDEILVPAHTFIATVWGPLYAGLKPVFCDVDARTGNIDVADAARRLTPRTKAIIPVHLYGQTADMTAVMAMAAGNDLVVIEDAAQAIGARIGSRAAGTLGRLGCFSFYPGKNLGGAGEAGLVVTDDDALAERVRMLRNHGQRERYLHSEIGYNYRMDGLQAVVLAHKLRRLDGWTERRRALADAYAAALEDLPLELPRKVGDDHVWHLYVVRSADRDGLRRHLADRDIATGLHYPVPCHRQPALDGVAAETGPMPESERWAEQGLSLPLYYGMTEDQQRRVIAEVRSYFHK